MITALENIRWKGYLRQDGSKGIRNKVLIIYTVECSSFVAQSIAAKFTSYDVDVVGFSGCYDNEYAIRMLLSLARHPNVGGVLVIGLGCEYNQPELFAKKAEEAGKLAEWLLIQNEGGTTGTIEKGALLVTQMLKELENVPMVDMGFEDLVIGAECGGSDYTSGLVGNVLVGKFFDRLVDLNSTVMFEEIVEAIGLKDYLLKRAVDENAKLQLEYTYDKALNYCRKVRQYSVSPGNFAGGLSTIEEKSMGAIIKSGSKPIQGVIKVSQRPPRKGLWLLDTTPDPYWMSFGYTNPNDNEGLMALISCGCHIVLLVTGRGNVVGSAVAPVVKITGNSITYKLMENDMDFDASRALSGEKTMDQLVDELFSYIISVCEGKKTKAELLGHKEYYIPYKYQSPTVEIERRC